MMGTPPLKIAVLGAGSIGCYIGGQLAYAGADVRLIGRQRFKDAIAENGLTLTHFARNDLHVAADGIGFDLDVAAIRDADIVLVTVKSQDTATVAAELVNALDKKALVISFQNGVSNADTLRAVMPDHTVLGGMVPFNVTGTGPGAFHCGTEGDLYVENQAVPALQQMQANFQAVGQGCVLTDDIGAVQWGKLLVNLNNAMNTLAGIPLKACLVQKEYRAALALMIEEALAVLGAAAIQPADFGGNSPQKMIRVLRLPTFLYKIIMNFVVKIDDNARSSMLDDLEAGRMAEIEYLQGEVVRLADKTGSRAPICAAIRDLVLQAFAKGASPKMSGAELLKTVSKA